jgi:glycerol-3-phosphate dehydrogenase
MIQINHKADSTNGRFQPSRFNEVKSYYDLIVVGGGIYGAALLWEAARRGISALLVERGDFAGGASANSLKIIHGGIRYLQHLDIPRIRSSAREQLFFLEKMPHLVKPLACASPCYGSGIEGRAAYQMAFWAYAALNADIRKTTPGETSPLPRGCILPPESLKADFPDLNLKGNTGIARWFDALALDTERIVLTLIDEACENGAQAINYSEMHNFLTEGKRVVGIEVKDRINGESAVFRAAQVATCTGDASMDTKNLSIPKSVFQHLRFARGVNIIVDRPASKSALALRLMQPNGNTGHRRLLFFVPWQNATMIGTWYFPGVTDNSRCLSEEELDLILSQINVVYPSLSISAKDVTFVHLGRLPAYPWVSPTGEPRLLDHGLIVDHGRRSGWPGLWSIVGVKYTTARAVAEKALHRIFGRRGANRSSTMRGVGRKARNADRHKVVLSRNGAENEMVLAQFRPTFGSRASEVIDWAGDDPSMYATVPGTDDLPQAALQYSIQHERVRYLTDLLLRRYNIGAAVSPAHETVDWAIEQMAHHLNWDKTRKEREVALLKEHYSWWKKPHEIF